MKKVIFLIMFLFSIFLYRLYSLNYVNHDFYSHALMEKTENYIEGPPAPRGRILDRNGVVLVDNVGINSLFYQKMPGVTNKSEIAIAKKLANIIKVDVINNKEILNKYYRINNDIDRFNTTDFSDKMSDYDKECATIYYLMNKGYSYEKKEIVKEIDDLEYSKIIESNLEGVTSEITWKRIYPYKEVLKDIFGTIGSIPKERVQNYLEKGYALDDVVGLSYLEYQYEDYLQGKRAIYKVGSDNTYELIEEEASGNDLVLSIDINVQLELEKIMKKYMLLAKDKKYTDYFQDTFAIIGHPKTGEILAMSGKRLLNEDEQLFKNINTLLINSSYTVGSVVKMASVSTGYKYQAIDIGTTYRDACIKLYRVPLKCSYKDLGRVNDLTAISKSSNYYQFKIALNLLNSPYKYNMKLVTNESDFNKFREMFQEYGLGSITNIDLPNEQNGIIGNNYSSDLYLNLSIGQYDTYTPIQLFQYVNTIASMGEKRAPQLMKEIVNVYQNPYNIISKVSLDEVYLQRLHEAMKLATTSGTARNFILSKYNPAGKTGTSETFIDSNNDGVVDRMTTSLAFVGFAPVSDPKYSIVVLAPHLYSTNEEIKQKYYITRYISKDITNFLFENY